MTTRVPAGRKKTMVHCCTIKGTQRSSRMNLHPPEYVRPTWGLWEAFWGSILGHVLSSVSVAVRCMLTCERSLLAVM